MAAAGLLAIAITVVGAARTTSYAALPLRSIVGGALVTQGYGCTDLLLEPHDPECPSRHFHSGVDLAARSGSVVRAATAGIAHVGFDPDGAGRYVAVWFDRHTRLLYCHLSAVTVLDGQDVSVGEMVGTVGATGLATGPHLHFEIQVDGRPVDPEQWLGS
jgi:murein DD-endopeptidase MepM/ murein hydrolase activator NlpD